jgi:hypothetical protein
VCIFSFFGGDKEVFQYYFKNYMEKITAIILPVNKNGWEEVIDFTKIKEGGVDIKELLYCI